MVFEKVRPTHATARPQSRLRSLTPERRRLLLRIAAAALGLLFVVALATILAPTSAFNVTPSTTSQYRPAAVAVLMLLLLVALVLVAVLRRGGDGRSGSRIGTILWWGFLAACLTGQLVLAHAVLQLPPYDAAQIFEVAYHLAVAPEPRLFPIGDQSAYFSVYPNNAFLVAVFAVLFGVLHAAGLTGMEQYVWASVVVNCVALTFTLQLTRFVVRRLAPGFSTAVTVLLGVALVVLSPWLNVAYSDTLAMAFPIGMLALWLVWRDRGSLRSGVLLFAILGVLAGVGTAVKPPVVFMAIALLLVTIRPGATGRPWRSRASLAPVVALVTGLGVTHFVVAAATHAVFPGFGPTYSMPFTHYMAMGSTGDGGFNVDDFNRTWALPAGARPKAGLFLYMDRVLAMGPLGYPLFLAQKMLYAFSDGSFFQGREGVGPFDTAYFSTDPFSRAVQSVFTLGSPLHWPLSSLWQAVWWSAVLLCFVPLRRLRLPRHSAVAAMRIALLLLLAFLCMSESRSRYLYHYLPLVLVLAGLGATALTREVAALRDRLRPTTIAPPVATRSGPAAD